MRWTRAHKLSSFALLFSPHFSMFSLLPLPVFFSSPPSASPATKSPPPNSWVCSRACFHSNRLPWKLGDSAAHPVLLSPGERCSVRESFLFFFWVHLLFTEIKMKLWVWIYFYNKHFKPAEKILLLTVSYNQYNYNMLIHTLHTIYEESCLFQLF